jgi:hypothetical protein
MKIAMKRMGAGIITNKVLDEFQSEIVVLPKVTTAIWYLFWVIPLKTMREFLYMSICLKGLSASIYSTGRV